MEALKCTSMPCRTRQEPSDCAVEAIQVTRTFDTSEIAPIPPQTYAPRPFETRRVHESSCSATDV